MIKTLEKFEEFIAKLCTLEVGKPDEVYLFGHKFKVEKILEVKK